MPIGDNAYFKNPLPRPAWIIILLLLYGMYQYFPMHHLGPGELAPNDPEIVLYGDKIPFNISYHGYTITPLATFKMRARVLHTHSYWFGRESDLSPVDFAMGWGKMSDQALLNQITIDQGARWYTFEYDHPLSVSNDYIYRHSGNMHMIPADSRVARLLKSVRENEIIQVQGYLVRVSGSDNFRWESSLSLLDKGEHACKLILVTNIRIEK